MTGVGYEAPGTGTKLDFAGTPHEGLEVTIDSVSIGLMTDMLEAYSLIGSGQLGKDELAKAAPLLARLFGGFAGVLESWNVTRKGEPVPATLDGVRSLDMMFVLDIIGAWITGTTSAGDDLGKGSASGMTSQEELIAAAGLSRSLPSS